MSATDKHTKVGPGIFSWQPLIDLRRASPDAYHLWWILYASAPAKLMLPGLWLGGIGTMADHSRMTVAETQAALDVLIERGLVEYDAVNLVLRFTELPDRCEAATSPNAIRGWWGKYITVPECPVKHRYLALLTWLLLPFRASKRSEKAGMAQVWDETFGAVLSRLSAAAALAGQQAPITARASAPPQSQLDLSLGPVVQDMYQDMSGTDRERERDRERQKGECERGCPQLPSLEVEADAPVELIAPPLPAPELAPPDPAPPPLRRLEVAVEKPPAPPPAYAPPDYLHDVEIPSAADRGAVVDLGVDSEEPPSVVEAHTLWNATRERVRPRMVGGVFDMFIDQLEPVERHGTVLHLRAPSAVIADVVRKRHQPQLERELHAITGHAMQIAI